MHLIYIDESGNTGCNLTDTQQPIFVLCALVVPEQCWQELELDLFNAVHQSLGDRFGDNDEIHAADLRMGRGLFEDISIPDRLALRDNWFAVAQKHDLKVIYRAIEKQRFKRWIEREFGQGVKINPHLAAFPLVAQVVDEYLQKLEGKPLGTFISDEQAEVAPDIEKSLRLLRGEAGVLRLGQIIEKGFFIPSEKSLPLQLCDVCALAARKLEESRTNGIEPKFID